MANTNMSRKMRGAIMVEYVVVSVLFSLLVLYALTGSGVSTCSGSGCVADSLLSDVRTEGAGGMTREYFDPDGDGHYYSASDGERLELLTYPGLGQSFTVKQESFAQSIYQP